MNRKKRWLASIVVLLAFAVAANETDGNMKSRMEASVGEKAGASADPRMRLKTVDWTGAFLDLTRWQPSGQVPQRAEYVDSDKSIRFIQDVPEEKGNWWGGPEFRFRSDETLAGAGRLTFEIKLEQPERIDRSASLAIFDVDRKQARMPFRLSGIDGWQTVTVDLSRISQQINPAKNRWMRLEIGRVGAGEHAWQVRGFQLEADPVQQRAANRHELAFALVPAATGGLFYETEPLVFDYKVGVESRFQICDAFGEKVASGTLRPGRVVLDPLPRGYYVLNITAPEDRFTGYRSFSVLPSRHEPARESAYAFDTGMNSGSGAPSHDYQVKVSTFDELLDVALRCGIHNHRSRNGWNGFVPSMVRSRERIARIADAGIATEGFPGIPRGEWAKQRCKGGIVPRRLGGRSENLVPDDLRSTYEHSLEFAERYGRSMKYTESFNEPDLTFDEPAWEIAAQHKAAFLGFKAGNPEIGVYSPAFAYGDLYYRNYLENDPGLYFDFFNFHVYWDIPAYTRVIGNTMDMLREFWKPDPAACVTENGSTYERYVRNKCSEMIDGGLPTTPEQEAIQAEFAVKSCLKTQRLGIYMNYLFYLPPQSFQWQHDWGYIRLDNSAKPGLTAFATLQAQLGDAEYLGSYDPDSQHTGMLFRKPDGSQTLALWRLGKMDTGAINCFNPTYVVGETAALDLPASDGEYTVYNLYGTPELRTASGGKLTLEVDTLPRYVTGLKGMAPQSPAPKIQPGCNNPPDIDKSIVARAIVGKNLTCPDKYKALAAEDEGSLKIQYYNFGKTEKRGRPTVTGVTSSGLPPEIVLPPGGMAEVEIGIARREDDFGTRIRVGGVFDGKKISEAVIPVLFVANASQLKEVPLPGANRAANWRACAAAPQTIVESEGGVRLSCTIEPNASGWISPEYQLRDGENLSGAVGVRMEMRLADDMPKIASKSGGGIGLCVDLVHEHSNAVNCEFPFHYDDRWHTVDVFFDVPTNWLKRVKQLKFGTSSGAGKATFLIRNVRILTLDKG